MTLNQAIKTLNIEGRRLTVPSVRKLTGIKSDPDHRVAIDKFKADLSRKEKEKEEKSQMNVKCAEIVVRWQKNRTWGSTCTAEATVVTENEEWHHYTSPVVAGCGYDKHSQALSYVFNAFFKGMIWRLTPAKVRRRAEKMGPYYPSRGKGRWVGLPYALHQRLWPLLAGRCRDGTLQGGRGLFGRQDDADPLLGRPRHLDNKILNICLQY